MNITIPFYVGEEVYIVHKSKIDRSVIVSILVDININDFIAINVNYRILDCNDRPRYGTVSSNCVFKNYEDAKKVIM